MTELEELIFKYQESFLREVINCQIPHAMKITTAINYGAFVAIRYEFKEIAQKTHRTYLRNVELEDMSKWRDSLKLLEFVNNDAH